MVSVGHELFACREANQHVAGALRGVVMDTNSWHGPAFCRAFSLA